MRAVMVVTALLIGVAVAGCSAGGTGTAAPAPTQSRSVSISSAEPGADVGDARPAVSYDGLMVRREVVIAVDLKPGADLVDIRRRLDRRAARGRVVLSEVSASVLSAAELEQSVPQLIVALPVGQPIAVANAIVGPRFANATAYPGVSRFSVGSVLIHDLAFDVPARDPARARSAIDREGILSDALDDYSATVADRRLTVTYTGPLLSDELVRRVQDGIARGAGASRKQVRVRARSSSGQGVDMAQEPAEKPVLVQSSGHEH